MGDNLDKLESHFEELKRRHRQIDNYLKDEYNNQTITQEVRMLKTQKLWLKDEMHRIQRKLNDS